MFPSRNRYLALILFMTSLTAGATTIHVPSDIATIQAAIDAAAPSGDEIIVAPGTYEEQLVITKSLTLMGAGIGQTIIHAPAFMPHTAHTLQYNAVIHVEQPATGVVLSDFTIDGDGRGRPSTRFTGIMYDGVGGRAERIEIMRMHDTPVSDTVSGIGFYASSNQGDNSDLDVTDLSIHDFQKSGFAVAGAGGAMHATNVVIDPAATYTDAVQNGFEMLLGAYGTLTNCTARMCWYDGDPMAGATSVGFLMYYGQHWTLENCAADQDQTGIFSIATSFDLEGSTVTSYPSVLNFNNGITVATSTPYLRDESHIGDPSPLEGAGAATSNESDWTYRMSDCKVSGAGILTSTGLTLYSVFLQLGVELTDSRLEDWDNGVRVLEANGGRVRGTARSCTIDGSGFYGIYSNSVAPFDARGNWWGDPSGPNHPSQNPYAHGDPVSDHVLFDPWLEGNLACAPLPRYISQDDDDGVGGYADSITLHYLGGGSGPIYGFSTELTWDQAKLTAASVDVSRPARGPFQDASLFQVLTIPGGLRVDAALGGNQSGVESGDLFRVTYHLVGAPDYTAVPIAFHVRNLRDNLNQEISGCTATDGLVIGDVQGPVISSLKLINGSLPHTDDYAKNGDLVRVDAVVSDGDPLFGSANIEGNLLYLIGVTGWQLFPDSYVLDQASWAPRPASLTPADGPVPFTVTATDPAGNVTMAASEITSDNTPPQAISGLVVTPGHNQIQVQWNDPTGLDAHLRHVAVRANRWLDYPQYATPTPGYPPGPTQGDAIYTGPGTSATGAYPADGSERDIVFVQAFAVDIVDLSSPVASDARGRATNYLLGDVNGGAGGGVYDGITNIYDITQLGDTFDLHDGDTGFDAECDVGPTDNMSAFGIPLPDDVIDFNDLMIFSIQFQNSLAPPRSLPATGEPSLRFTRVGPQVWSLELCAPCPQLKGLRLRAKLPDGVTAQVEAGALLAQQGAPYFLHGGRHGDIDASLAMLGRGVGVAGQGELLRVVTSQPVNDMTPGIDARDLANATLVSRVAGPVATADTPLAFASRGNHPNPFNPSTAIAFDLPSSQPVRVTIYALDGRRVARLLDGTLPAGRHQVTWKGCDDAERAVAAGVYVYRLEAGPWSATGKLNLVK